MPPTGCILSLLPYHSPYPPPYFSVDDALIDAYALYNKERADPGFSYKRFRETFVDGPGMSVAAIESEKIPEHYLTLKNLYKKILEIIHNKTLIEYFFNQTKFNKEDAALLVEYHDKGYSPKAKEKENTGTISEEVLGVITEHANGCGIFSSTIKMNQMLAMLQGCLQEPIRVSNNSFFAIFMNVLNECGIIDNYWKATIAKNGMVITAGAKKTLLRQEELYKTLSAALRRKNRPATYDEIEKLASKIRQANIGNLK